MSRRAVAAPLLLLGALACSRDHGAHRHPPLPSGGAEEGAPAFLPPTAVVDEPVAASTHTTTVTSVRVSTHGEYDRVVVALDGGLPGRRLTWLKVPPHRCGSSAPLALRGAAWLELRLDPAQAHDAQGHVTVSDLAAQPQLPSIAALALGCDAEGVVTWAIGAPAARPYRVLTLNDPPRVVVDIAHGAATPP
jgi:hypothetical protein